MRYGIFVLYIFKYNCFFFSSLHKRLKFVLLFTPIQVFELMRGLDKDCDSTIDLQEFASRFEVVFTRLNAKQDVRITLRSNRNGVVHHHGVRVCARAKYMTAR